MSKVQLRKEYSEDEIEQSFSEAFTKPALFNDVSTWEADVDTNGDDVTVSLEVTSMAGDLTKDQFEVKDEFQTIEVAMFDGKKVRFGLDEVLTLNGTDYRAIYVPIDEDAEEEAKEEVSAEVADDSDVVEASDLLGSKKECCGKCCEEGTGE